MKNNGYQKYSKLDKVLKCTASLKNALEGMIQVMTRTIETRDPYIAGHQERVAGLAVAMASHRPYRPALGVETAGGNFPEPGCAL